VLPVPETPLPELSTELMPEPLWSASLRESLSAPDSSATTLMSSELLSSRGSFSYVRVWPLGSTSRVISILPSRFFFTSSCCWKIFEASVTVRTRCVCVGTEPSRTTMSPSPGNRC
jgi:hypothetical protein